MRTDPIKIPAAFCRASVVALLIGVTLAWGNLSDAQEAPTATASVMQRSCGPELQFDTKGVEFGPWVRRFMVQLRRNWIIPYAAMSNQGHVVITFYVHKDGAISELLIKSRSTVEPFNDSAYGAVHASSPTVPFPPEYPSEKAFFTATFYFSETPPGCVGSVAVPSTALSPGAITTLIGQAEEEVRHAIGEPTSVLGPRWTYYANGSAVYIYFADGRVSDVFPKTVSLEQIKR